MAYIGFAPTTKPLNSDDLQDGIVTEAKIATDAVTLTKIANASVTTHKIANANVLSYLIANANVTTHKIANANVLSYLIANANVTTDTIANANVLTSDIELANITTELLIDDAVSSSKIAPLVNLQEDISIVASAFDNPTNIDLLNNSVYYCTAAADTNFTINFRANGSTPLNDIMATGNTISAAIMVTNTGSPYYINAHQVDGSSVTPKYQGGTAYSAGNANSIDVYTFTIIKTADATFTVIAAQTQFA